MNQRLSILLVAISVLLVSGCSTVARSANDNGDRSGSPQLEATRVAEVGEYILPGNPRHPVGDLRLTPETAPPGAEINLDDVPGYSAYDLLVRGAGGKVVPPTHVLLEPAYTRQLGETYGFTFYYEDGLILAVVPVDSGAGIDESLASTIATNTQGLTRTFTRGVVRNRQAAVREAGVQKWGTGTQNSYPTCVKWTEPSPQGVLLEYSLLCYEQTSSPLKAIAAKMTVLEASSNEKHVPTESLRRDLLPLPPVPIDAGASD